MSIEIINKLAKIFYALVLWMVAICILLLQLFVVKALLKSVFENLIVKLFFYVVILTLTVLITDFLRRKIPRFYLLFILFAFVGLLLIAVYITK